MTEAHRPIEQQAECPHCGWTPAEQDELSEKAAAHDCVEETLRDLIDIASRQDAALIALRRHLADLEFASGVKSSEIERLRAALERIQDARLTWAMVCQCTCKVCDEFYELISDVEDCRSADETKAGQR